VSLRSSGLGELNRLWTIALRLRHDYAHSDYACRLLAECLAQMTAHQWRSVSEELAELVISMVAAIPICIPGDSNSNHGHLGIPFH
jgi:hypothetical protein